MDLKIKCEHASFVTDLYDTLFVKRVINETKSGIQKS